jgi:hypothetical protein
MEDDFSCKRCEQPFFLRGNTEPTAYCDNCAQVIAAEALILLKKCMLEVNASARVAVRKILRESGVFGRN